MKYLGDRVEAELVLKEQTIGRLGMFSKQYPYILPINYVYEQGNIYLHSGPEGQKLNCIEKNNNVCFQVDQVSSLRESEDACNYGYSYRSVILQGKAEIVSDKELKRDALELITQKFAGKDKAEKISEEDIKGVVVIKINIEEITVKINEK